MKKTAIRSLAVALLASAALTAAAIGTAPDKALHALFDREFKIGLQEHPELATLLGYEEYNDRLTDQSAPAIARRKAAQK
jgi:hypothetical protein